MRVFEVDVDDWASYLAYWDRRWDGRQPPPLPAWDEVLDRTIDTDADRNERTETTVSLGDVLGDEPGHVIVVVEPTGRFARLTPDDNEYWSNRPAIVWAQSTNIGVFEQSDFSTLSEFDIKVRRQFDCGVSILFGYSFLYWSDVARAGDQIDLSINTSQIPPGILTGPAQPAFPFDETGFWAQGLRFGVECLY